MMWAVVVVAVVVALRRQLARDRARLHHAQQRAALMYWRAELAHLRPDSGAWPLYQAGTGRPWLEPDGYELCPR